MKRLDIIDLINLKKIDQLPFCNFSAPGKYLFVPLHP